MGGIVATLGVVFPSLVIITIIAAFYPELRGSSGREERFCGNPGLCLRFDP